MPPTVLFQANLYKLHFLDSFEKQNCSYQFPWKLKVQAEDRRLGEINKLVEKEGEGLAGT